MKPICSGFRRIAVVYVQFRSKFVRKLFLWMNVPTSVDAQYMRETDRDICVERRE